MYKFSLVMATYGRLEEIDHFFDSILSSDYDLNKVEIIVVDQNDEICLDNIIEKYNSSLNIKHIKSDVKGLSKNRNIGIRESKGEYIAFPDDDCKYMNDTLKKVESYFENNKEVYAVMGRIVDEDNNDCIRKWSKQSETITKSNFYTKLSSITLFKRNEEKQYFNEQMGVGAPFGSNEDANIIYKCLKSGKNIKYYPDIVLYHPKPPKHIELNKVYNYGLGFGALCKENLDINMIILFIKVIVYHFLRLIIGILTLNKTEIKLRCKYIESRISGFTKYNRKDNYQYD